MKCGCGDPEKKDNKKKKEEEKTEFDEFDDPHFGLPQPPPPKPEEFYLASTPTQAGRTLLFTVSTQPRTDKPGQTQFNIAPTDKWMGSTVDYSQGHSAAVRKTTYIRNLDDTSGYVAAITGSGSPKSKTRVTSTKKP